MESEEKTPRGDVFKGGEDGVSVLSSFLPLPRSDLIAP